MIPNLFKVEMNVWRGGQPDETGWGQLKALGIKRIIKLNTVEEGSDDLGVLAGMQLTYVPITFWQQMFTGPRPELLAKCVEGMLPDGTFVHCGSDARTRSELDKELNLQGGQDRTGLLVGMYRVMTDHWTKDAAYAEMRQYGFHAELVGLSEFWQNDVEEYAPVSESVV